MASARECARRRRGTGGNDGFLRLRPCLGRADLVFLNGAEPETVDPALITGQPEGRIASSLFEGLTAYSEEDILSRVSRSAWEISEDGLHYTFHLRKDAKWSDGSPVTAPDFVAARRRARSRRRRAPSTAYRSCTTRRTEKPSTREKFPVISQKSEFRLKDDYTLLVELEESPRHSSSHSAHSPRCCPRTSRRSSALWQ